PLAFGRGITNEHSTRLFRSVTARAGNPAERGVERFLLCSHNLLRSKARSHGPEALGLDDGTRPAIEAGTAEIVHVLTRPLAPPGERQVTALPEELRRLREHRWERPWPTPESLSVPPEGYERVTLGPAEERADVWGLPNTDINQHVNATE